jgi:S-formylglutathione hydrolase FrmB
MARNWLKALAVLLTVVCAPPLAAQAPATVPDLVPDPVAGAKPVTVERITIHGAVLEGNLEGDTPDRSVIVYLPPSYAADSKHRYPVVYALHGYSSSAERLAIRLHTPQTIEGAFATGTREMIVVILDAKTLHDGSMYANSVTTGDWEDYIAHDVVAYIDGHYRTIPDRLSRGLAGHSMGGFGTLRTGMKHPEVFGVLYAMSPCCMSVPATIAPEMAQQLESVKVPADSAKLTFYPRALLATAAAMSPNPKNPPLYLDLPVKDGVTQSSVMARWNANAPLTIVHQYLPNLRQYRAIAIDVGDQDSLKVDAGEFHRILDDYGIANSFEIYSGTHVSALADRIQNHVLPFFSQNLKFAQ